MFKETEIPILLEEAMTQARKLLISSLNKGMIPSWEDFFQELPVFNSVDDLEAVKEKFIDLTVWPFLKEVLNLPATEFFFHSPGKSQRLTFSGEKLPLSMPFSPEDWQLWLEIISIRYKQNWNVQNPFCSFYGELHGKNYRFSMIHGSTSPGGVSKLMLRCLSRNPHAISSFGEAKLLIDLVKQKKNILIAGSTGSGKTSLLTSLLDYVKPHEHVVVLEDTYEILSDLPHQTRFISGDSIQTSLKSYLTYSLRLSPDRIILGEMRSHEVVPFLMAMNTGHQGLMGTLHASSAYDTLHRVALLFILYSGKTHLDFDKVMELICRNLEYVVFMENKRVKEVIKILGTDKGTAFFEVVASDKEVSRLFN